MELKSGFPKKDGPNLWFDCSSMTIPTRPVVLLSVRLTSRAFLALIRKADEKRNVSEEIDNRGCLGSSTEVGD